MEERFRKITTGKAIALDGVSDIYLRDKNLKEKAKGVLKDLWSGCLNNVKNIEKHFMSRIIPLNKVHPHIPTAAENRPIVVESQLVKLLETYFLPKAQTYLREKMIISQTGFVTGLGITVNIVRAIKQIKLRTDAKKECYGLFIDLKSAYNTIYHTKLFKLLENIYDHEEIMFLKAMWARTKLKLGNIELTPNVGVPQGSLLSPSLFNIYFEIILKKLQERNINLNDILAYADDLLIICDSIEQLKGVIKMLKEELKAIGLIMNSKKSAIVEFKNRYSKKQTLTEQILEDIPVLTQYRYLGLIFDQKLTIKGHMDHINKKMLFQLHALSKVLPNITAGYRKNLWMTFIKPLFELASLLYYTEQGKSNKMDLERQFYQSFKRLVGLSKSTPNSLVRELCGYNLKERAGKLWKDATNKWIQRLGNDIKVERSDYLKPKNLLQYISQDGIKLINLLNRICPICKNEKMTESHLKKHRIIIPSIIELFSSTNKKVEKAKREDKLDQKSSKRGKLISEHNGEIINIKKEVNKFFMLTI